jgi:DMSO/TMAO reductase YedYZ molybdopterin-dependent catalytic subunit
VDGYVVCQPLAVVLSTNALLAYRMNGVALPMSHGFPLRALIPGHFGEENAKWVTRIELTDHFVGGLYSDQGWYNGPLHTISRIDKPKFAAAYTSTLTISGIAYAGTRRIQRVEISTDAGLTWHDATLSPPLSPDTWVLWNYAWMPAAPGSYTLTVRATDGTGTLQIATPQGTVPDGATGYHSVHVTLN